MNQPENIEIVGKRAYYRPVATTTFEKAMELAGEAMRYACSQGCVEMLANLTGLTGFPSPSTIGRYAMAQKWAESAGSSLRVAMVVRHEVWDPQKIGVLMAQNRGVNGEVFLTEIEALRWLDAFRTASRP
jgi:hypothetical protein